MLTVNSYVKIHNNQFKIFKGRCLIMKRIFLIVMLFTLLVSSAMAAPSGKVMLYSSMQEDQLVAIKKGFEAKYPDIVMDYYFAGTGRVITKIATEHQAGQVAADVIWVGDPSDYLSFKKEGILEKYSSPEASAIASKFIDPDGFYTGARMMNMGIGLGRPNRHDRSGFSRNNEIFCCGITGKS